MDLVTKLVILATALVGLYKAATFSRGKPKADDDNHGTDEARPASASFSALFELLGLFLFMLAFPAFIWGFTWITRNISTSKSEMPPSYSVPIEGANSATELALVAAAAIASKHDRDAALKRVVEFALAQRDFKVAIAAATAIPTSYEQAAQLKRVIDAIQAPVTPSKAASNP